MCKWGTDVFAQVFTGRDENGLVHTGNRKIDKCIASLVQSLNNNGVWTVCSCCGHGKRMGSIRLEDGRELFISEKYLDDGLPL